MIPRIIAHRGASAVAPENTLAAFRAAAAAGAKWVEFDVSLTSDGRPVVFHDDRLDRTTDGSGLLAHTSFEELQHLDAGSWFSPRFAGTLVPTLEEVLETLSEVGLGFNMEIKPDAGREIETAETALKTATASWSGPTPLVSSFARAAVAVAREQAAEWPRGLLCDRLPQDWQEMRARLALDAVGANQQTLSQTEVAALHQAGLLVTAYTVNSVARAKELFAWGVDAVFTDDPASLLRDISETVR